MKPTVLFVVGEPGAGKTTLVRRLLEPGHRPLVAGKVKWTVSDNVVAAGTYLGGQFDGADTVPYDGARPCLEMWRDAGLARRCLTIMDGDRFSNASVLAWFAQHTPPSRLVCLYLATSDAARRRAARGTNQNPTWVKGRATKARNFYDSFPGEKFHLDSSSPPDDLAVKVRKLLS